MASQENDRDNIEKKLEMATINIVLQRLISAGALTSDAAQKIQEDCQEGLVAYLAKNNLVKGHIVATAVGQEFGLPFFDLKFFNYNALPKLSVKGDDIFTKFNVAPLYQHAGKLFIAIADPSNLQALEDLKTHIDSQLPFEPVIVEYEKMQNLIQRLSAVVLGQDTEVVAVTEEKTLDTTVDEPIVKFINKTILDAVNQKASDIHFEPYEKTYRVRLRQDGVLRMYANPPINHAAKLETRLKVMSNLDIAERRVPQDGRFKLRIGSSTVDFRVSTCPTLYGEKIVIRILDAGANELNINVLGMDETQKTAFMQAIERPQGMILVTGPTGSGKTVTLYTALNILNVSEYNISTVEDPVEINLVGVNQVHVNVKAGLTFASALRAFLRQDPDIVMVGEIRDLETAEVAVKASQTGHLVLSTLHTNSAPETLVRLVNMGVPTYNLATSIILIAAQRLARRLCERCKKPREVPVSAKIDLGFTPEEAEKLVLYQPVGCSNCKEGYKGRVALYEIMPITPAISDIIMRGANALEIAAQARKEGINTLRQSGLDKIRLGITTPEEVYQVV